MSSTTWTADAVGSEARPYDGTVWRLVEAQNRVSTMRLAAPADQALLEELIEEVKPSLPPACRGLHFLLATPFRYAPYPHGSRFRRPRQREGVFYAAEQAETAVAELAFYRLLFFAESPGTPLPSRPNEFTAFSVPIRATCLLDLTRPPLDADKAAWTHPTEYGPCQALADTARTAGVEVLRYQSVRDPVGRANVALLTPAVFGATVPSAVQTWHLYLRADGVQARREFPRQDLDFPASLFAADPRLSRFQACLRSP